MSGASAPGQLFSTGLHSKEEKIMRTVIQVLLVIAVLGLIGGGCCNSMNHTSLKKEVTVLHQEFVEAAGKSTVDPKTAERIANLEKLAAAESARVAKLQRELDEARKLAKVGAPPPAPAPVAPATPNPAVMKVLDGTGGGNSDMVLHLWTGKPAVIHELNASTPRTDSPTARTKMDAKGAEELKDVIGCLRDRIRSTEISLVVMKNSVNESTDPGVRKFRRIQIERFEEGLAEMQTELANLSAELKRVSP